MPSTKERILTESLKMFSERGYDSVSMRDIAAAVGIKAASIYQHYKGKQEIIEAILNKINESYLAETIALKINGVTPEADAGVYYNISKEKLMEIGRALFAHFIHDEYTVMIRKLATIEQYKNTRFAEYLTNQYMDAPLRYQSELFRILMEQGGLRKVDPEITAMEFFAPIYYLMCAYDRQPERENEIIGMFNKHIEQFAEMYACGQGDR